MRRTSGFSPFGIPLRHSLDLAWNLLLVPTKREAMGTFEVVAVVFLLSAFGAFSTINYKETNLIASKPVAVTSCFSSSAVRGLSIARASQIWLTVENYGRLRLVNKDAVDVVALRRMRVPELRYGCGIAPCRRTLKDQWV